MTEDDVQGAEPDLDLRFPTLLNAIPQVVWSTRPDGFHDFFNDRWYEFTGAPRGTTNGAAWADMFHPDDTERAWQRWRHSLATGEPYEVEYRLRHHSGAWRWTLGRALPVRGADGNIERWFGTCTDIHDLKIAEEQRELIAGELSHRIKNIFTVVSSLITLSLRAAPAARPFAQTFRARIDALAQAHDHVRPHGPASGPYHGGQTVRGLIAKLLAAYNEEGSARIGLSGDDAAIGVTAATSLALVVHELATNAIKYGALSQPGGQVAILCLSDADTDTHVILWRETGGPPVVTKPATSGFGTLMSERALNALLGASLTQDWQPTGLVVRIAVPLEQLIR